MKMRLELSIVLSILIMQCAFGQTSEQDTFFRAAGIDAIFVNNFIPLDNQIGSRGNYLFHYFEYDKNDHFIKHALDIDLVGSIENNESDLDKNDARFNFEYRISKGKRKEVFKNVCVLYGVDFSVDYFLNRKSNLDPSDPNEDSFNTNLDQSLAALVGPGLGLGYIISKRVSIYTEAGFYLKFKYGIDRFKSDLNPNSNFKDTKATISTTYVLPSSFILFYHF